MAIPMSPPTPCVWRWPRPPGRRSTTTWINCTHWARNCPSRRSWPPRPPRSRSWPRAAAIPIPQDVMSPTAAHSPAATPAWLRPTRRSPAIRLPAVRACPETRTRVPTNCAPIWWRSHTRWPKVVQDCWPREEPSAAWYGPWTVAGFTWPPWTCGKIPTCTRGSLPICSA